MPNEWWIFRNRKWITHGFAVALFVLRVQCCRPTLSILALYQFSKLLWKYFTVIYKTWYYLFNIYDGKSISGRLFGKVGIMWQHVWVVINDSSCADNYSEEEYESFSSEQEASDDAAQAQVRLSWLKEGGAGKPWTEVKVLFWVFWWPSGSGRRWLWCA